VCKSGSGTGTDLIYFVELEWEVFHKSKELPPTLIFSLGLQDFPFRQKTGRGPKQTNQQAANPPQKKEEKKVYICRTLWVRISVAQQKTRITLQCQFQKTMTMVKEQRSCNRFADFVGWYSNMCGV
jgi:hypothetical protein